MSKLSIDDGINALKVIQKSAPSNIVNDETNLKFKKEIGLTFDEFFNANICMYINVLTSIKISSDLNIDESKNDLSFEYGRLLESMIIMKTVIDSYKDKNESLYKLLHAPFNITNTFVEDYKIKYLN